MTRRDGIGFRTFEEFVTSRDGLNYPDYPKFRGLAISEPGVMNEREYDLLTAAPAPTPEEAGKRKGSALGACPLTGIRKVTELRAIHRAPVFVRKLYIAGLVDVKLAALLGPDEKAPGYQERRARADIAAGAGRMASRLPRSPSSR